MTDAKIEDIAGCLAKDVLHPEIAFLRQLTELVRRLLALLGGNALESGFAFVPILVDRRQKSIAIDAPT